MFSETPSPLFGSAFLADTALSGDVRFSVGAKRSVDGLSNASNSPKRRLSGDREHVDEVLTCRVPGCKELVNEETLRNSHRIKLCMFHQKVDSVEVEGVPHRFCQQCTRLHPLDMFDGDKRGCRKRLERHNRRRQRKAKIMKLKGEGGASCSMSASGATGTTGNHTYISAPAHVACWEGGVSSMHSAPDSAGPGSSSGAWGGAPISRDMFLDRNCASFTAGSGNPFMQRVAPRDESNLDALLEPWGVPSAAGGDDIKAALEPWGISTRHSVPCNQSRNQEYEMPFTDSMMNSHQVEDRSCYPSNFEASHQRQIRNWMGMKQHCVSHPCSNDFQTVGECLPRQTDISPPSGTCQPYIDNRDHVAPSMYDMLDGNMASQCMRSETRQFGQWRLSSEECCIAGQHPHRPSYN